ncbi:MAG: hypothetical protein CME06_16530 [Gemmatimonadetes bacterium]|nr:hypothetical protein [Gemmatimonadota bacterium]
MATPKRSDLTEDPVHEQLEYALAWAMKNRNRLAVIATVLVAAVAISSFYLQMRSAREDDASTAFLQGLAELNLGNAEESRAIFTKLGDDMSGTAASRDSELYLANSLFWLGEHGAAKAAFESYLGRAEDQYLRLAAKEGLAACAEEQKDWRAAAEAYTTISREHVDETSKVRNLMAAARCLATDGDMEGARALYLQIEESHELASVDARVARSLLGPASE